MLTHMKCIQDFNLVTIVAPMVDLSYQNESVKTGPIDVRISIELETPSHKKLQLTVSSYMTV